MVYLCFLVIFICHNLKLTIMSSGSGKRWNKRKTNGRAARRQINAAKNKVAAKPHIFDKSDDPKASSKKIQACLIASKVTFQEMTPEEQKQVSLHSTVTIFLDSNPLLNCYFRNNWMLLRHRNICDRNTFLELLRSRWSWKKIVFMCLTVVKREILLSSVHMICRENANGRFIT